MATLDELKWTRRKAQLRSVLAGILVLATIAAFLFPPEPWVPAVSVVARLVLGVIIAVQIDCKITKRPAPWRWTT